MSLVAIVALVLLWGPATADAGDWTGTRSVASKSRNLTGFSADLGDNGYAVMAYVVPGESLPGEFEGAVFVKVRRPGERHFRAAIFRGVTRSPFTDVEIGPGGMTLVTYRGENGLWRVATRWPSGGWLGTQELQGASSVEAPMVRIGREGSAAILGLNSDPATGRSVDVALRDPASGLFSDWVAVSAPENAVGSFASIAPSAFGGWTVVWSSPCSVGDGLGEVRWVELDSSAVTDPYVVRGSGCVTRGLDLQADRQGNQFLRIGLADGIQLAARKHDRSFGQAAEVTAAADRTDAGHLAVSGDGQATLIWSRAKPGKPTDAYLYVTARPGGHPAPPRKIRGLRLYRESANDVLKDAAPLPHGSLALAFTRSWFTGRRLVKVKVGTAIWKSGTRIEHPLYTRSGPAGRFVNRIGVETSFRGSALTWWSTQTELTARPLGYWWRAKL